MEFCRLVDYWWFPVPYWALTCWTPLNLGELNVVTFELYWLFEFCCTPLNLGELKVVTFELYWLFPVPWLLCPVPWLLFPVPWLLFPVIVGLLEVVTLDECVFDEWVLDKWVFDELVFKTRELDYWFIPVPYWLLFWLITFGELTFKIFGLL